MIDVGLRLTYDDIQKAIRLTKELDEYLHRVEKGISLHMDSSDITRATKQLSTMESTAKRVESIFATLGGTISKAGSALQGLGNIFGGRVVNTAKTMATAFATMGLYSAAQGTVERYDTMRMFPKMMEHLGYSADDATVAVKKLEDAVIGLPTGLDEIVASARQLIPLTGDLNKGVNLAIAANNAFLAGGADANATRFGQRQIKDLLAKGTLRSQEWDSLFTALGSGLGVIAEAMGYSSQATKGVASINDEIKYAESRLKSLRNTQKRYEKEGGTAKAIQKNADAIKTWEAELAKLEGQQDKSLGSFRSALKSNQISALDFLDALEKVGTGEGELAKRADDYKDTISAAARNIKNAMQKLGAAGLEALDNVLVERTGKGIPGNIREISDSIKQNLVPALEGWVSANGDKIVGFFDKLKNYDWIGLVSKVGKGLAQYYDLMTTLFTKVSPKLVAWLAVWAGPVGRMMQVAGSGITGLGKIVGKLITFFGSGKARALDTVAEGAGALGRVAISFKTAFQGLGLAAGGVALIAEIGAVIAEYVKIGEMIGKANWGNFDQNIGKLGTFIASVGGIATALVATFGIVTSSGVGAGIVAGGELLAGGLVAVIAGIGGVIAEYVKVADSIATMHIPSENQITKLGDTIKSLNTNLLGNVKKVRNKDVNSLQNLSEMVEYTADIARALKKVKDVGQVGDMSKRIAKVINGANAILDAGYDKEDKKKSKVASATLENLASGAESIGNIADTLVKMKDNIQKLVVKGDATEINNLTSGFDKVLSNVGDVMHNMQFRSREYQTGAQNVETIAKGVESIGLITSTLVSAKGNIESLMKKDHGHVYTDIGSKIGTIIDNLITPLSKYQFKTKEYSRVSSNLGKFAKIAESIGTVASSLVGAMENLNALTQKSAAPGLYSMKDNDISQKVSAIFRTISRIANNINEMDIDTSGAAKEKITALSDVVSVIPSILEALQSIKEPMGSIGVNGDEWTLGDNIKTVIKGLKNAFDGISDTDYSDLSTNAQSLTSAVNELDAIMTSLGNVKEKINALVGDDMSFPVGEKLKHVFAILTEAFSLAGPSLDGSGGSGSLASVAPALEQIATQLGEIASNGDAAASALNEAGGGVNKLGDAAKKHNGSIKTLASNVKSLKYALDGIFGNGMSAAMGVAAVGNAAANQISNLYAAASAARSLASAINSIPSQKSVNVSVSGNTASSLGGSIGRILGGVASNFFASGGEVRGPGGIDNVPAWLTSGEFVMTKRAHSAFGSSFMNRINNLDVEGAMRALSLRAGSGILSRAKVTNNYTRDNHANVTFNVNRATQGYSQRRASRWARALS